MNGKWPRVVLMSAATAAFLLYSITSATEAPGRALAILQYALLVCALVALVGAAAKWATDE